MIQVKMFEQQYLELAKGAISCIPSTASLSKPEINKQTTAQRIRHTPTTIFSKIIFSNSAVAQLAERALAIPEVRSSNLAICKLLQ